MATRNEYGDVISTKDETIRLNNEVEPHDEETLRLVDKFLAEHPEYFYDHERNMLIKLPVNIIGDSYPMVLSDMEVEEILNKFARQCGIIPSCRKDYTRPLGNVLADFVRTFEGRELTAEEKEMCKGKVCTGIELKDWGEPAKEIAREIAVTINKITFDD